MMSNNEHSEVSSTRNHEPQMNASEVQDVKSQILDKILNHQDPPYITDLPDTQAQAQKYHVEQLRLSLFDKFASYVILGILVWFSFSRRILTILSIENFYLQVLVVALANFLVLQVLSIGIGIVGEYQERKYGFSTRSNKKVLKDILISFFLEMVFFEFIILGVYVLMKFVPRFWWFYAFLMYFVVAVVLMTIAPVIIIPLFMKIEPLPECELKARVRNVADTLGITYNDIYLLHLSDQTQKANAAVVGFGKTTKIVLGDTLLSNFRKDEIEIVMAHEIGHKKNKDMLRMLVFQGLLSLIAFYVIDVSFMIPSLTSALNFNGLADPASISYLLLVYSVISEFLSVVFLWYSRRRERAADAVAISYKPDLQVFKSAFIRLATQNLSYLYPHPIEVIFFYSHPPILERIQQAEKQVNP